MVAHTEILIQRRGKSNFSVAPFPSSMLPSGRTVANSLGGSRCVLLDGGGRGVVGGAARSVDRLRAGGNIFDEVETLDAETRQCPCCPALPASRRSRGPPAARFFRVRGVARGIIAIAAAAVLPTWAEGPQQALIPTRRRPRRDTFPPRSRTNPGIICKTREYRVQNPAPPATRAIPRDRSASAL
jgi:hypothetical protein